MFKGAFQIQPPPSGSISFSPISSVILFTKSRGIYRVCVYCEYMHLYIFLSSQIFFSFQKLSWEFQNTLSASCFQDDRQVMVDFMEKCDLATLSRYLIKHHFNYCREVALTPFISATCRKAIHLPNMSGHYPISRRPRDWDLLRDILPTYFLPLNWMTTSALVSGPIDWSINFRLSSLNNYKCVIYIYTLYILYIIHVFYIS